MTAQTITATFTTVCHFTFIPIPDFTVSQGALPVFIDGYLPAAPDSPADMSVVLDDAWHWDLNFRFQGAPPIEFNGFNPSGGGNLFDLLTAQGWVS